MYYQVRNLSSKVLNIISPLLSFMPCTCQSSHEIIYSTINHSKSLGISYFFVFHMSSVIVSLEKPPQSQPSPPLSNHKSVSENCFSNLVIVTKILANYVHDGCLIVSVVVTSQHLGPQR